MKKTTIFTALIIILSIFVEAQTTEEIKAIVPNTKDNQIMIDDFLALEQISLSNSSYTITYFEISYKDSEYFYSKKSNSNTLSAEQKEGLSKLKDSKEATQTIYIEGIKAKSNDGKEIRVEPLILTLYLK